RTGERRQAAGDDDVVPVPRYHQQGARTEQVQGVGYGAGTENDVAHAALMHLAGMQDAGVEQAGYIRGARGAELTLPRNAADQTEAFGIQYPGFLLECQRVILEGALELTAVAGHVPLQLQVPHLVDDYPQHLGIVRPAEALGMQLDAV